jgi:dihydrolipoamide dehydrogenase
MKFKVNTRFTSGVNNRENGVEVVLNGPKGEETFTTDIVLLSIGRKPFTGGLQLENTGLSLNERGQIPINKHW